MTISKRVEQDVLRVFRKEIPSIHFSDKTDKEFIDWTSQAAYIYRDLLHVPPEMFRGASLIDFGAGTGENTIHFANWGARCTLVEINDDALNIAKKVFQKHARNLNTHRFVHSSMFDYRDTRKYDFVLALGSLHHTNEKERAFSIIASYLKPGGYLILGMSTPVGGLQNNLQRLICYKFGKTDEEIVAIAERLFKNDIDRAQELGKRARRAIIFDRWVVPKQDDPTFEQVLGWFRASGLRFYHSNPPVLPPVLADSARQLPRFDIADVPHVAGWAEAFFLSHNDGDAIEVPAILENLPPFSSKQSELALFINNIEPDTRVDLEKLENLIDDHLNNLTRLDLTHYLKYSHQALFTEIRLLLRLIERNDLNLIAAYLPTTKHLFRGMNGLRNVFYVAWKC